MGLGLTTRRDQGLSSSCDEQANARNHKTTVVHATAGATATAAGSAATASASAVRDDDGSNVLPSPLPKLRLTLPSSNHQATAPMAKGQSSAAMSIHIPSTVFQ